MGFEFEDESDPGGRDTDKVSAATSEIVAIAALLVVLLVMGTPLFGKLFHFESTRSPQVIRERAVSHLPLRRDS